MDTCYNYTWPPAWLYMATYTNRLEVGDFTQSIGGPPMLKDFLMTFTDQALDVS